MDLNQYLDRMNTKTIVIWILNKTSFNLKLCILSTSDVYGSQKRILKYIDFINKI